MNFKSIIATLFASNNVGALIKFDVRSLLRFKIIFARACVRVDISEPLLEYIEVKRVSGNTCGYIICVGVLLFTYAV